MRDVVTRSVALSVALVACGPSNDDDGGSATTGGCGDVPLCDLCPDESAQLCGMPCPTEDRSCSNTIGDGMQCGAGTWTCVVHPPLGTECNEVCAVSDGCSEIGCSSGITAVLVADGGAFAAGVYELAAVADGEPEDCTFTISTDPDECAIPPCVTDSDCNAVYVLTEDPMRIELAYGVLATLELTLTRDDLEVAHGAFTPAYEIWAPNGPGCGPACAQAIVELAVQ
jgi:hypothetical protein